MSGVKSIAPTAVEGLPPGEYSLIYRLPDRVLNQLILHPSWKEQAGRALAQQYGATVEFTGGGVAHMDVGRRLIMRFRVIDPGPQAIQVVGAAAVPLAALAWAIAASIVGISLAVVSGNLESIVVTSGQLLDDNGDLRAGLRNAGTGVMFAGLAAALGVVYLLWGR